MAMMISELRDPRPWPVSAFTEMEGTRGKRLWGWERGTDCPSSAKAPLLPHHHHHHASFAGDLSPLDEVQTLG